MPVCPLPRRVLSMCVAWWRTSAAAGSMPKKPTTQVLRAGGRTTVLNEKTKTSKLSNSCFNCLVFRNIVPYLKTTLNDINHLKSKHLQTTHIFHWISPFFPFQITPISSVSPGPHRRRPCLGAPGAGGFLPGRRGGAGGSSRGGGAKQPIFGWIFHDFSMIFALFVELLGGIL